MIHRSMLLISGPLLFLNLPLRMFWILGAKLAANTEELPGLNSIFLKFALIIYFFKEMVKKLATPPKQHLALLFM